MSDTMQIEDYLAQGGVLSVPGNAPPRYRGELMRLMSSFVDSELAASAGFAASINEAPGIQARIAASRITLEKADHALRVLNIMQDFGTDTERYQRRHDWASRVARDADLGSARHGNDMRLSVFHYPLCGWTDAVVMNVLQGLAAGVQFEEFTRVSYAPLAEVFRDIEPRERHHVALGLDGLSAIVSDDAQAHADALASLAYWRPRVAATFGVAGSARYATLARFGLRHVPNEVLLSRWEAELDRCLAALDL